MQVVIVAGGRGTRMRGIAPNIPKPLLPINGKPILEYQIELAKRYGVNDFIILSGYLGDQIASYFGNGRKWGVKIVYFQESMPLGNAGCLKEVESLLKGEFFVFYGDTIMDIALDTMVQFHDQRNALGTLFLHPNDHPFDSDLVEMNNNTYITDFFPKPHEEHRHYRNLVSAGLYILRPDILKYIEKSVPSDFGRHVFPKALSAGECIAGYVSPEYIKDMGTPERYNVVAADVISGKVARLNRKNKRVAFFLDRDGVINRDVGLLSRPDDFELLPGVVEAIKKINESEYLAIVVTNQSVIARNLCDFEELKTIHTKMESLLGKGNAFLDAIYFCPHHPDAGYPEERSEYKLECDCRKPKPGMLLRAAKDYNIDLSLSFIIGDSEIDIFAGEAAGVKQAVLLKQNSPGELLEAVERLLKDFE